ncbi:hypothetical protein ONZ43_g6123 [Nemania bipapillata]|uniref:Uncharacterized protein n=1 Tax=Nemania bipapillata TaxID=110536 RepID=A0ACC2I3A3_9PEZI|nr:hypothetical protein ONZ43_g6123 [Nemania bipapillata]
MTSDMMPLSSKATLSAALAKARTAVQLDQAEYHDGAKRYYVEVVELLGRVIVRASNENDIKKLKDIRRTYTNRIEQLDALLADS